MTEDQTFDEFMQDVEKLENSLIMKLIKVAFAFLYISMFGAFWWMIIAGLLPI